MVNEEKSLNVLIEQYYDAYTVVLCFVSSDYFLFSSWLTHFTSLSYSSENMIEN